MVTSLRAPVDTGARPRMTVLEMLEPTTGHAIAARSPADLGNGSNLGGRRRRSHGSGSNSGICRDSFIHLELWGGTAQARHSWTRDASGTGEAIVTLVIMAELLKGPTEARASGAEMMESFDGSAVTARSVRAMKLAFIMTVMAARVIKRSVATGASPWQLDSLGRAMWKTRLRSAARRPRPRRSVEDPNGRSGTGSRHGYSRGSSGRCGIIDDMIFRMKLEGDMDPTRRVQIKDVIGMWHAIATVVMTITLLEGPVVVRRSSVDPRMTGRERAGVWVWMVLLVAIPISPSLQFHLPTLARQPARGGGISRRRLTALVDKLSAVVHNAAVTSSMRLANPLAATGGTYGLPVSERETAIMDKSLVLARSSRRPSGHYRRHGCTCLTREWARAKT